MSSLVSDQLIINLNTANGFSETTFLVEPVYRKTRVRFLGPQCCIQTNFITDSFILNPQDSMALKVNGLALVGDDKLWYVVNSVAIQNPVISIYTHAVPPLSEYNIVAQFV